MVMKPSWLIVIQKQYLQILILQIDSILNHVTLEDVLAIVEIEKPEGVIVHYGGQTPLKLAQALEANGVHYYWYLS